MKPQKTNAFLFFAAFVSLLAVPALQAQTTYYWDNNGTAGGFGTAGGTWADPTISQWSTSSDGTATPGASITTATNSTLHFGSGTNGLAAGTITVSGTVNSGNMNFAAGSATTPAGAITLSGGKINFASAATITFNKISDNGNPPNPSSLTGDVTITSEISGSGNLSFLHAGNFRGTFTTTLGVISNTGNVTIGHAAGTANNPTTNFILSGASTYTGSTNFSVFTNNSVRLQLGIANGLSTASVLNFGNTAGGGSGRENNLNLNGFNQTLAGVSGTSTALRVMRVQNTSATAATLTIDGSSNNTFSGMLGSNGFGGTFNLNNGNNFSVVKNGSGTWILDAQVTGAATNNAAAPNTYTGLTTINGGAIRIQHGGALGSTAAGTVVNGTNSAGAANARLELAGGITVADESLTISGVGNFFGALASVDGDNVWAGPVTIGAAGTRIGAINGTSLEVSGVIDSGANAHGLIIRTANLDSTVILSGANTYLGNTQLFIGKLQLDGGDNRLPVGTDLILSSGGTNPDAEFDLNGRNQEVAGLSVGGSANATQNSVNNSSLTGSTLTVNNAGTSTYAGILKGNLGLTKDGAGTLDLTGGSNTYTGLTTINAGTLALGADGTIDDTSGVVLGGGTFDVSAKVGGYTVSKLSGVGAVIGSLSVSTQLAIGNSPGTVGFEDLTLDPGATYLYELTGGGITADLGNVSGTLTLTGALLDLVQLGTYSLNDKFTLFAYQTGNLEGTFSGLADGTEFTDAGGLWKINYFDTSTGLNDGEGTSFVTITAIPEPAAAALGGLGVLLLLRRRRA